MGRVSSDAAVAGAEKRLSEDNGQSRRVRGKPSPEMGNGKVKKERGEEEGAGASSRSHPSGDVHHGEEGAGASSRSAPNGAAHQGDEEMREREEDMEEEQPAGGETDEEDEDDNEPLVHGEAKLAELQADLDDPEEAFPYFSKLVASCPLP